MNDDEGKRLASKFALTEMERHLITYGDATFTTLPWKHGDVVLDRLPSVRPRYRVTRRGNVYDDVYNITVHSTWGIRGKKARYAAAEAWIVEQASKAGAT